MVVTLENKMFFNPFRLGQAENEKVQMDSPKKKAVGEKIVIDAGSADAAQIGTNNKRNRPGNPKTPDFQNAHVRDKRHRPEDTQIQYLCVRRGEEHAFETGHGNTCSYWKERP